MTEGTDLKSPGRLFARVYKVETDQEDQGKEYQLLTFALRIHTTIDNQIN